MRFIDHNSTDWTRNGARIIIAILLAASCTLGIATTHAQTPAQTPAACPVSTGVDVNAAPESELQLQIGRASCRERV